jgi:hypothetical protein
MRFTEENIKCRNEVQIYDNEISQVTTPFFCCVRGQYNSLRNILQSELRFKVN